VIPLRRHVIVVGFNSFQYAGNPAVTLGEARRVPGPGGAVVIVTWGSDAVELISPSTGGRR
jgi:hypothetical protein